MAQKANKTGIFSDYLTLERYRNERVRILKEEFLVTPTEADMQHLHSLKTKEALDIACRKILFDRWERDDEAIAGLRKA